MIIIVTVNTCNCTQSCISQTARVYFDSCWWWCSNIATVQELSCRCSDLSKLLTVAYTTRVWRVTSRCWTVLILPTKRVTITVADLLSFSWTIIVYTVYSDHCSMLRSHFVSSCLMNCKFTWDFYAYWYLAHYWHLAKCVLKHETSHIE